MKNIIYCIAMIFGSLAFFSCNSGTKELFEESAAERVTAAMNEAKEVLCSSQNGWLMKYYPSRTKAFGGYNVLISFTEDGYVSVSSELFDADKVSTSHYRLKEQAGPTLTLDTENEVFHLFSNPNSGYGSVGLGMEGDYEFTILSATPDKVVLKGKKSGNNIEMTPFPVDQSWVDYLTDIKESFSEIDNYFMYEYKVDGESFSVTRNNNCFSISFKDVTGERLSKTVPYILNANGIDFADPLVLGDKEVSSLVYDSGRWKNEDGSVSLEGLKLSTYEAFVNKGPWFITYDGLGDYGKGIVDNVRDKIFKGTDNNFLVVALGKYLSDSYDALNIILEDDLDGYKDGEGLAGFMIADIQKSGTSNIKITTDTRATDVVNSMIGISQSFMDFVKIFMSLDSETSTRIFTVEYDRPYNPSVATFTERSNPQNTFKITCIGDNNAYFDHQYD